MFPGVGSRRGCWCRKLTPWSASTITSALFQIPFAFSRRIM